MKFKDIPEPSEPFFLNQEDVVFKDQYDPYGPKEPNCTIRDRGNDNYFPYEPGAKIEAEDTFEANILTFVGMTRHYSRVSKFEFTDANGFTRYLSTQEFVKAIKANWFQNTGGHLTLCGHFKFHKDSYSTKYVLAEPK